MGPSAESAIAADEVIVSLVRDAFQDTLTMVRSAVEACPDDVWSAPGDGGTAPFWQQAYHTISSIDFWMHDRRTPFAFPPFHTDPAGLMHAEPGPQMDRQQVLDYLQRVVDHCNSTLSNLSPQTLLEPAILFGREFPLLQRLLGQIRHSQHHVGTMHALLRRKGITPPRWK